MTTSNTSVKGSLFALVTFALVTGAWPPEAKADFLTNTAVTRQQFGAAFDLTNPVNALLQSPFNFPGGGVAGVVSSQVFRGQGANADIFAYLYQVAAPQFVPIRNFEFDFPPPTVGVTIAGMQNRTSIYINQGVAANTPVGGFTTLGNTAPADVFDTEAGRVLVRYAFQNQQGIEMGAPIPAGGTGFIVGIFSRQSPMTGSGSVQENRPNREFRVVEVYSPMAVPEPGGLVLLGSGGVALLGLAWRRRRRVWPWRKRKQPIS